MAKGAAPHRKGERRDEQRDSIVDDIALYTSRRDAMCGHKEGIDGLDSAGVAKGDADKCKPGEPNAVFEPIPAPARCRLILSQ